WQDRRTEPACKRLREAGHAPLVQQKTGLLIDAYFSATKLQWLLDHVPGARAMAERGELAFGTVDTWLLWQLSGGAVHATDVSNASRTMLFNIHTNDWDNELLELFNIPHRVLPRVQPSAGLFAHTQAEWLGAALPVSGMAGDQQSALFGQACFSAGQVKNTYGTGCFMLMHTGVECQTSHHGLITTSAAQTNATPAYALEGSVFIGGAVVQWLRDGLHAFDQSADVQALAASVPDAAGVVLVPAFTGLGAPYWQADARGTMTGLSRGTTMAHIARAALESIAFQSTALLHAMNRDAAQSVTELRVDGGACVNDLLMQFQADLLGIPVLRPVVIETTALGAAYLAGLGAGIYQSPQQLSSRWRVERAFEPLMSRDQAAARMAAWDKAVRQTVAA
ncbi:MAG: glycerol kinase, partial [Betaproteobacteria bacterium]